MVHLKSPEEIEIMAEGGRKLAEILRLLITMVQVGTSTGDLDKEAEKRIRAIGGEPAFKGYRAFGIKYPFPGSICTSINDEIVHGLPYPERRIEEGDAVSLDIGMKYKGFFTDTAYTVGVGVLPDSKKRLIETATEALSIGLEELKKGVRSGHVTTAHIGAAVQTYVESRGFNVVRELVGHGVGKSLHEDPAVPNFRVEGGGEVLSPGTVIAIEPMIYEGGPGVEFEKDEWTVRTAKGGSAAHFEHTVAILENDVRVLT